MSMAKKKPELARLRYTLVEAAEILGVSYEFIRRVAVTQNEFTTVRSNDARHRRGGPKIFLLREEVEIYGTKGVEALREHRASKNKK